MANGGKAVHILDAVGIRWNLAVRFTLWPLYFQGESPRYSWVWRPVYFRSDLGTMVDGREKSLPRLGIGSSVTLVTELPSLLLLLLCSS
jgi:hypothetical protein